MNLTPTSSTGASLVFSADYPHSATEAETEFLSLPEEYSGYIEETLNTNPPFPDGSYCLFRTEQNDLTNPTPKLQVARVQHEPNNKVNIYIDSFDFDPWTGLYTFASSDLFDQKENKWVQQQPPHFLDRNKQWLCLNEFREDYGNGREVLAGQVDEIYELHNQLVFMQNPPCFYNQANFDSKVEATLDVLKELEKAPDGAFTVLGNEIHPNRYKLCFSRGNGEIVIEELTISATLMYQTKHGSFASFDEVKAHYKLTTPISTDMNTEESTASSSDIEMT